MFFDYFYEHEAEQFAFYMIPKEIVEDKPFCELSDGSKLLYSIILDRVKLSRKNGWIDDKNRVYIIFTVEEVQNTMRCAKQKATKLMQELEAIGLIEKKRQGLGKPNLLYVKNFVRKGQKSKFQKNENHTSGSMEIEKPEVPESYGINNNQNNFRGYKNLKIVGEKFVEAPNSEKTIKVFIAGGKEIDKKVAEANKKVLEKYYTDRVTIAGGKEIDKKVAEANKKILEANK